MTTIRNALVCIDTTIEREKHEKERLSDELEGLRARHRRVDQKINALERIREDLRQVLREM